MKALSTNIKINSIETEWIDTNGRVTASSFTKWAPECRPICANSKNVFVTVLDSIEEHLQFNDTNTALVTVKTNSGKYRRIYKPK